ncbi:MAG TPA: response regulator [Candidatus Sulfotelmatobacter sp.]|nr:response regulator [Candidatus Sulfotelmatobacter sp.]
MHDITVSQDRPTPGVARRRLLIVDHDEIAAARLAEEMRARGFEVRVASNIADSLTAIAQEEPDYALVEVRLGAENGLEVVGAIHAAHPKTRIVICSCYGTPAIAVSAIKAGGVDCFPKTISVEAIAASLLSQREPLPPPIDAPLAAEQVRWRHIRKVLEESGGNVSDTARRLRMHRRTLQRILANGEPPR